VTPSVAKPGMLTTVPDSCRVSVRRAAPVASPLGSRLAMAPVLTARASDSLAAARRTSALAASAWSISWFSSASSNAVHQRSSGTGAVAVDVAGAS